jgi:microcystin-dependent protein
MSLETATYLADLQPANPPSTDPTSQGDDHLRLIKQVLQNQFPGPSRAWAIPSVSSFSTSPVTVTKPMDGSTLFVSTASGATVVNLPTLTAGDTGWSVGIYKTTTDVNPMFVTPPSGSVVSGGYTVTRARRCIPGVRIVCIWTGTQFVVSRAGTAPIASMLDFWSATLPAGYEWPNGQTLSSSANYPEYFAALSGLVTPDVRGYVGIPLDNLGGAAAGRLPNGQISGSVLGAVGGIDASVITVAQMPSHNHSATSSSSDSGHSHTLLLLGAYSVSAGGTTLVGSNGSTATTSTASANITTTTTIGNAGSGSIRGNLQPSIMLGKILVVE